MKRRVIQFGESTHVITLPCKWLKKQNIKKGDELEISEEDYELRVSSCGLKNGYLKATIELSDAEKDMVNQVFDFLHKKGYCEINIVSSSPEVLEIVQRKIPSLAGFEIIDQKKNSYTIKNITEGFESEIESILLRMFSVTSNLANKCMESIRLKDNAKIQEEMHSLAKTNKKLTSLCHRILNTNKFDVYNRYIYNIIGILDSITQEYDGLCDTICSNQKMSEDTMQAFQNVNLLLEEYIAMFNNFSVKGMSQVISRQKQVNNEILRNLGMNSNINSNTTHNTNKDAGVNAILLNIIKRMHDFVEPTLALKLQISK